MTEETAKENRSLESRIRAIEDRLEIYNLIAGHPPSADTGADYYAEAIYAEDGEFDRGAGLTGGVGNKAIAAGLRSPAHKRPSTAASPISPDCRTSRSTATMRSSSPICRFSRRTSPVRRSKCRTMAHRAAITSTA